MRRRPLRGRLHRGQGPGLLGIAAAPLDDWRDAPALRDRLGCRGRPAPGDLQEGQPGLVAQSRERHQDRPRTADRDHRRQHLRPRRCRGERRSTYLGLRQPAPGAGVPTGRDLRGHDLRRFRVGDRPVQHPHGSGIRRRRPAVRGRLEQRPGAGLPDRNGRAPAPSAPPPHPAPPPPAPPPTPPTAATPTPISGSSTTRPEWRRSTRPARSPLRTARSTSPAPAPTAWRRSARPECRPGSPGATTGPGTLRSTPTQVGCGSPIPRTTHCT